MSRWESVCATTSRAASSSVDCEGVAYQGLALVITDSRMMSDDEDEEGSRSWPSAIYTTVSWGAAFYLLGVMRDVLVLSGDARDDVHSWLHRALRSLVIDDGGDDDAIGCTSNRTGPECNLCYLGMGAICNPCIKGSIARSQSKSRAADVAIDPRRTTPVRHAAQDRPNSRSRVHFDVAINAHVRRHINVRRCIGRGE